MLLCFNPRSHGERPLHKGLQASGVVALRFNPRSHGERPLPIPQGSQCRRRKDVSIPVRMGSGRYAIAAIDETIARQGFNPRSHGERPLQSTNKR